LELCEESTRYLGSSNISQIHKTYLGNTKHHFEMPGISIWLFALHPNISYTLLILLFTSQPTDKIEQTHSAINFNLKLFAQKSICSKFSVDFRENPFFFSAEVNKFKFFWKKAHDNFPKIVIYFLGELIFFLVCEGNSMQYFGGKWKI
jgi:hypothetical protein